MSAEQQPDPILPNYNPSSWDVPTLSPEERAILDTEYITFPIAQNQNITFPVAPTAPTLTNGTNTTQVATTGFVQNAITAFKAAPNFWAGIQTFSAGISTATISAISGTFTITGATTSTNTTFSGTTTLSNPITPGYSYPIASGKIGQVIDGTFNSPPAPTGLPQTNGTITDLPIGVWIISGSVGRGGGATGYVICSLSTTTNSYTGLLCQDSMVTGGFGSTTNISFILVNTTIKSYFLLGESSAISTWGAVNFFFKAVRIA